MLTIKENFIASYKSSRLEIFRKESLIFLRKHAETYTQEKHNDEILAYIDKVIHSAQIAHIKRRTNIQKLMLLVLHHPNKFSPAHKRLLTDANLDEDYRIDRLAHFLDEGNKSTLVTVDTDLTAYGFSPSV